MQHTSRREQQRRRHGREAALAVAPREAPRALKLRVACAEVHCQLGRHLPMVQCSVLGHGHGPEEKALHDISWSEVFQAMGCLEGNWPLVWVGWGASSQRPGAVPSCESLAARLSPVVRLSSAWKRQSEVHPNAQWEGRHWCHHNAGPSFGRGFGSSGGILPLPHGWNGCRADFQKQMSHKHHA